MKTRTEMIKSKFSNQVHRLLNPNPVKNSEKWKQKKIELTDAEKVELFDKILQLEKETSNELGSYWFNRREHKRIQRKRIANGYKRKRKTSLAEYERMTEDVAC